MLHLLALAGILGISFSAVFVRLASVSPVTAAFYRAAYAIPVLAALSAFSRGADPRPRDARLLAVASGLLLALDLSVWHASIALVGVGLATVVANVQVVFVALGAWIFSGERPSFGNTATVGVVLCGLALTSGLARGDAYGASPGLGTALGVVAGGCYAGFLLTFRAANKSLAPTAGPLLDSTLGTAAGSLLVAPFDPHFAFAPHLPAHAWLLLLALVSQVAGWLFIATALARLPALETSVLLLVQPVFSLVWGVLFFAEDLSSLQWVGSSLVLGGVGSMSLRSLTGKT